MNKGTLLIISFIGNFNKLTISFEELLPFAQFCARDTRHLTFKLIEGNAYLRIHFEYFTFMCYSKLGPSDTLPEEYVKKMLGSGKTKLPPFQS